jgi:hypothetical protein
MAPPYIPDMADPYITYETFSLEELGEPDEDSKLRDAQRVGTISFYGSASCLPVCTSKGILVAAHDCIVLTDTELAPISQSQLDKEIVGISCSQDESLVWCLASAGNQCDVSVRDSADLHEVAVFPEIGFIPVCPVIAGPKNELIVVGNGRMKTWSTEGKELCDEYFTIGNGNQVFVSVMARTLLVAAGDFIHIWDCGTWERSLLPLPSPAASPVVQGAPGTLLIGTGTGLYHIAIKPGDGHASG